MTNQNSSLSFRVSAGLKNIIGRDLISDKYIAIFELVKNSYDAGAYKVDISFIKTDEGHDQIVISDNGCGMTYNDIVEKWLFVAYSEKKPQNREKASFRDEIKREVAGAKGVGRFSCDRLGALLTLVTKTESEVSANKVEVNWNKFELDDTQEFMNIPVQYSTVGALPSGFSKGTTLIVDALRESWSRDELLRLKRSLMKLISPDANKGELPFDIELIVPAERENDNKVLSKAGINPDRDIVNGIIHNDIFEKLNIKTTSIEVNVSEDGQLITSKLTDRGEYIFSFVEINYNVTAAEKLIPACDIDEQISLASKEASGTGNMKFMLNGAVTIGTMDGANVEIAQLVGEDNIYIFGESSETVMEHYAKADYVSKDYYEKDEDIRRAVDFIVSDELKRIGNAEYLERLHHELISKDWFMTLLDWRDYMETKERMFADYEKRSEWAKKMLINISQAGFFSSDRTIAQYNEDIWKL